ncbi:hypothetical protein AOL_s00169g183 [Orbilia oligospora ATCC 24927]|uniref:3CxxC-type domain-containing protein n=1 Tax=Arthrobotrys oligospora (strain ATCC 24927 / CBS 115.81 / DSM 1491) TaxID=756982 RepID=G1XMY0_ARTOA|nr:hypothetical protein AOL_s00169g183 [Orbilia oligospora ATCC 24927]EGX45577.1 hypothetical protein AOL_s00169g183 [Orbilia oligospora ATCC 24927]
MAGADEKFGAGLRKMDRHDLNRLTIQAYTRAQRRMINEERVRRKRAEAEAVAEEVAGAVASTTAALLDLINTMAILRMNSGGGSNSTTNRAEGNRGGNDFDENRVSEPAAPDAHPPVKKKKPRKKPKNATKKSYLFPEYHHLVAEEVKNIVFKSSTADGTRYNETWLVGSLKCSNCGREWTTGKVATAIRGYEQKNGQLGYSAEVFNQRCAKCKSLGHLTLDVDTYVERVARRLAIWKGELIPEPRTGEKPTPPHETDLCEGCAVGKCVRGGYRRVLF